MVGTKRIGVVSLDILNNCYSILNELTILNKDYSYDLKREKRIRTRMKNEAGIHSVEIESGSKSKKKYVDEDIKNLNNAYTLGKKNFNGKLNKKLLMDIQNILEPSGGVSTFMDTKPHQIRLNGDPRILLMNEFGTPYPYVPPTSDISPRLEDYIKFANDGSFNNLNETLDYFRKYSEIKRDSKITDLEKALLTHFHIATIHPFFDGNGRVSRLMQSIMLEIEGFTPGYIPSGEKFFYCNILADAQLAYKSRSNLYFKNLRENKDIPNYLIKKNYCYVSKKEHLFFDYLASKVLIGLKSLKKESLRQ